MLAPSDMSLATRTEYPLAQAYTRGDEPFWTECTI